MLVDIGQFPYLLVFPRWDMTPNFDATDFSITALVGIADGDKDRFDLHVDPIHPFDFLCIFFQKNFKESEKFFEAIGR